MPNLSQKEQTIAQYILDHPEKVSHSSISDLSKELNIADSTFFQFTKKLGFSGFKNFKLALLMQESDSTILSIHETIEQNDNELTMSQKVFDSNIQALKDTRQLLVETDLVKAADLFTQAHKVSFFGIGGSNVVAQDAFHKFLRSPISVNQYSDYHIQLMEASLLNKTDCAFVISHSGQTKETIKLAEVVKKSGAALIVLTSRPNSKLAEMADLTFLSIAEEIEFRSEALSSRISQLSIIDCLFVICMFREKEASQKSIQRVRNTISPTK
ncbi:MurR/RpiR family transcriptional regulator [Enterococcus sp. CWB-B31]|uniref:MurR/RpiR family transcriptional regulator n=1 Tax=Enterococcus sp. CWB-B31 TaxID=2885159 RepID=UPI001E3CD916|nr:MurR/RpiR family transcriptional regulator [Enterococcus sp. CWB-B31]MCB5954063.1 MurR/RpiR family transcriptional regulator [Enterococcus sp. CWB-B31]